MRAVELQGYSIRNAPASVIINELKECNIDELLGLKTIIEVVLRAKGDAHVC